MSVAFSILASPRAHINQYGGGNGLVVPLQDDLLHFVTEPPPPLITFNPAPAPISHPHEGVEVGDQLFVPDLVSYRILRIW
jgi:hypothetical protein